jgi:hypothetical protein
MLAGETGTHAYEACRHGRHDGGHSPAAGRRLFCRDLIQERRDRLIEH